LSVTKIKRAWQLKRTIEETYAFGQAGRRLLQYKHIMRDVSKRLKIPKPKFLTFSL